MPASVKKDIIKLLFSPLHTHTQTQKEWRAGLLVGKRGLLGSVAHDGPPDCQFPEPLPPTPLSSGASLSRSQSLTDCAPRKVPKTPQTPQVGAFFVWVGKFNFRTVAESCIFRPICWREGLDTHFLP